MEDDEFDVHIGGDSRLTVRPTIDNKEEKIYLICGEPWEAGAGVLDPEQVSELIDYLQLWLDKVTKP